MIKTSELPKTHGCGTVFATLAELVRKARFDGLQPLPLSNDTTDAYCFTCKKCQSSFLIMADRKFTWHEVHAFFNERATHMQKGDDSTWQKRLREIRKNHLSL